jgi:glycosyltransferase involved in cell wall biosynthesis
MRVYHLIKSLGRGGAEMLLPEGIRATSDRVDYRVGYFLPHKDALVETLERTNTDVVCFDAVHPAQILRRVPTVARDVLRFRADVVHCHLPWAGVAGRLVGRLARVPVVYTEHNLQPRYHRATFRANQATWRLQDRVIACSEDVARSIHTHIGRHVPVRVVQNGVATGHFQRDEAAGAALRAQLGIPPDAPVMATVAVFRTQKRLTTWLEVAQRVRAALPDAHFLLVGDGPLRADVEQAVERLGLSDRVHLPGLVEEVRPWLSAADVYVMSSEFEGLPIALLEAMAMGLAAVCTEVGGIGEVVREGREGHLVPGDRPLDLVEPVVAVLSDRSRARRTGADARARVVDAFGMNRMMAQVLDVYEEAIDGR